MMRKFFLLPVITAMAWAQDAGPAPAQPPADPEAALRARVQEFFQLQVEKKYRQGEALVAEDTKDVYYNGRKFNIRSFRIQSVELLEGNTKANVTIVAHVTLVVPAGGMIDVDTPRTTAWKLENGQWMYHVDQSDTLATPFGEIKAQGGSAPPPAVDLGKGPSAAALQNLVKADRNSVTLTSDMPQQTVTISNDLPGPVDLALNGDHLNGFTVKIEKAHLDTGEKTTVFFTSTGEGRVSQTVVITANPLSVELPVTVSRK